MSVRAARLFLPILRDVERDLAVPIPQRTRILQELEFDLEELRGQLMAEGLTAGAAREKALDILVPGPRVLSDLGRLHASPYTRATLDLGDDRLRLIERSALAVVTASVLGAQTLALLRAGLLGDPSPFLWPVLGLGALLFAMILSSMFEEWVERDYRRADRSLASLLGVSAVILGAGCGGAILDLYRVAGTIEQAPERASTLMVQWVIRDCALLSVALLLALAGALTWMVLTQWRALVSGAHDDVLGLDGHNPHRISGDEL